MRDTWITAIDNNRHSMHVTSNIEAGFKAIRDLKIEE